MPLRAECEPLLLYDPSRSRSTVNVWIGRPTNTEDAGLGKIFLLSAIDSAAHVNHEIIGILQDELRTNFYRPEAQTFERRFEETLQATNRHLHALIADGVNDWVQRSHFLVGAIQGSHLILSPIRSVHAYLLRKSRLHDILGLTDSAPPNPLRIFGHVIAGQVEAADRILICLPSLLDYFSLEKIRRTVLDHTPNESVRLFEQALIDVDPSMAFGALVVSVSAEAEAPISITPASPHVVERPTPHRQAPQRSMDELISTERTTERILTPSVWPAIKETAASVWRTIDRGFRTLVLRRPPRRTLINTGTPIVPPVRESTTIPRLNLGANLGLVRSAFRRMSASAVIGAQNVRRMIRRPERTTTPVPSTVRTSIPHRILGWWSRTNRVQRGIGAVILVGLILLSAILARNGTPTSPVTAQTTATEVEAEITRARAALAYGGESIAREALATAETKLTTLPTKRKTDRETHDRLVGDLATIRAALAHEVALGASTALADLQSHGAQKPNRLVLIGTSVYVVQYDHANIWAIQRTTKDVTAAATAPDIGTPVAATVQGTRIVMTTDRPGIVEYNPANNTWVPSEATFSTPRPTVASMTAFEQRLYMLDTQASRLLRYTKAGTTFSGPVNWLKDTPSLQNGVDLIVDGSVYIGYKNGNIEKYFSGRKASWKTDAIVPTLTSLTHLWSTTASTSLYVLDPSQKRIIVFSKEGALQRQLVSADLGTATDFSIDETAKKIYVLRGTQVDSYDLPVK